MALLPDILLFEVHTAAVKLGLKRDVLLGSVDRFFAEGLKQQPNHVAQLLSDLQELNLVDRLDDGTVPLEIWLRSAHQLSLKRPEAAVFLRALQTLRHGFGEETTDIVNQKVLAKIVRKGPEEGSRWLAELHRQGVAQRLSGTDAAPNTGPALAPSSASKPGSRSSLREILIGLAIAAGISITFFLAKALYDEKFSPTEYENLPIGNQSFPSSTASIPSAPDVASGTIPKASVAIAKSANPVASAVTSNSKKRTNPIFAGPLDMTEQGRLWVHSRGGYCNVTIDGVNYGSSPVMEYEHAGTFTVACKAVDLPAIVKTVEVRLGETVDVAFDLYPQDSDASSKP